MEASQQNCYDCCLTTHKNYARNRNDLLSELEHCPPRPLSPLSPAESLESLPPATPSDTDSIHLHHYHPFQSGFRCSQSPGTTTTAVKAIPTTNTTAGGSPSSSTLRLGYPSPPSTTSDPKHSVPLPTAPQSAVAPPPPSPSTSARRRGSTNSPDDYDIYYDLHNDTTTATHTVPGDPNRRVHHHHAHPPPVQFFGGLLDSPIVQHRALITRPTTTAKDSPSSTTLPRPRQRQRKKRAGVPPPSARCALMGRLSPTSPPRSTLTHKKRRLMGDGEWISLETGVDDDEGNEKDAETASSSALLSPLSPEWESHALECYLPSPPSTAAPAPVSLSRFLGGFSCGSGVGGEVMNGGDDCDCDCDSAATAASDSSGSTPSPRISPLIPLEPLLPPPTITTGPSVSWTTSTSNSKPILPLLNIPQPGFTSFRSYAPSPSSSLWLADDPPALSPLYAPPGSTTAWASANHGSETDDGDVANACNDHSDSGDTEDDDENRYLVSPPSSGPPETPSPEERSNTRLRPHIDGWVDNLFDIEEEDDMNEGEKSWDMFEEAARHENGLGEEDELFGLWERAEDDENDGMDEEGGSEDHDLTVTMEREEDLGLFGVDDDSPRYPGPTIPDLSNVYTSSLPLTREEETPPQPAIFLDDPPTQNDTLRYSPAPSTAPSSTFQPLLDRIYRHFDEDDHRLLQSPSSAFRTFSDLPELSEDEEMADEITYGWVPEQEVRRGQASHSSPESEDEDKLSLLFGSHVPSPSYMLSPPPASSLSPRSQEEELDLLSVDRFVLERLPLPPMEREEVVQLVGLQERAREAERAVWEVEGMVKELTEAEGGSMDVDGEGVDARMDDEGYSDAFGLRASDDALREQSRAEKEMKKRRLRELKNLLSERRAFARREREKAREAGVLVRLKLEEQGVLGMLFGQEEDMPGLVSPSSSTSSLATSPTFLESELAGETPSSPSNGPGVALGSGIVRQHPRMASIAHLVAKMFLNRHQAPTSPPLSISIPALTPAPREDSTTRSPSDDASTQSPGTKYKYRPLWLKGLEAAASSTSSTSSSTTSTSSSATSSAPSTSAPTRSRTTGSIASPSPSIHIRSRSGRGRASTFPLLDVGFGFGSTMPFLEQAFQKRYKFLRSSPLARSSCTVPSEEEVPVVERDGDGESWEGGETNAKKGGEEAGELMEGLGEFDGIDAGFEALSRPIVFDAEKGGEEGWLSSL